MATLKTVWGFFQTEVLGMRWLNRLIERPPKYSVAQIMGFLKGKRSLKIFLQDKNHSKDCRLPWFFNGYCEKIFCFEGAHTYVRLPQNSVL